MRDLPAPQHSAALHAMLGLPPPQAESPAPLADAVPRLEAEQQRRARRRRAAARARGRHEAA